MHGRYVKISNLLAQHRELSITAIGLATHIQSLPEGAKVTIKVLAERFPEGEVRIAAALKELEEHGYLARYQERLRTGRVVSHIVSYNIPAAAEAPVDDDHHDDDDQPPPEPPPAPKPPVAEPPVVEPPAPDPAVPPAAAELPEPSDSATPETHAEAQDLLARLRLRDPRLLLSERDVNRLAPAVATWLERGIRPSIVSATLAGGLPVEPIRAPAALLAHRLREWLPPRLLPPPVVEAGPSGDRVIHPFVNCEGCELAFRSPEPGYCRDCAPGDSAVA
ncbi:helix-turn-helix domain-containing protein [Streptomyces bambusae]|uniref:Helix-turn-helix domain-containing protein n=1 Tax=Streptomyces bambusae TaxID=1550616 RepID=A0ABS6YZX6_9ACTN|nr:helix-turn-helix domain-containing protein [Streptomyces bambusae]